MNSVERRQYVTISRYWHRESGKKSDEKESYIDKEIGVGRRNGSYGCFSLVGYLMGGEECNKRRMNDKAEEKVPSFFSLAGE